MLDIDTCQHHAIDALQRHIDDLEQLLRDIVADGLTKEAYKRIGDILQNSS